MNAVAEPRTVPIALDPGLRSVAVGDGDLVLGGCVVRVFVRRRRRGYKPSRVAAMVVDALRAARRRGEEPTLVVLPAGVGRLDDLELGSRRWTPVGRRAVRDRVNAWVDAFGRALPAGHPPIVVGLDGRVRFEGRGRCRSAVQLAAVVVARGCAHFTPKTLPANAYERSVLDRPLDTGLETHRPVAMLSGTRSLLLLCHDAMAFSARARRATKLGSYTARMHREYDALLEQPSKPRLAINILHKLPKRHHARMVSSPGFQNSHRVLRDTHGLSVVAVSAVHRRCAERAFVRLSTILACDGRHVDVLIDA